MRWNLIDEREREEAWRKYYQQKAVREKSERDERAKGVAFVSFLGGVGAYYALLTKHLFERYDSFDDALGEAMFLGVFPGPFFATMFGIFPMLGSMFFYGLRRPLFKRRQKEKGLGKKVDERD